MNNSSEASRTIFINAVAASLCETRAATGRRLQLFPRVMRRRRFRLGRLFDCFLIGLDPFGVKDAGLIDPFVSMRAEEIALRLQKVCR